MSTQALVTARTAADVRVAVRRWRSEGESVAFVPTMGNLHDGHVSLAALAAAECDHVVASIFVNPTQFGPSEDFAAYPRTLADDIARLDAAGTVDLLFAPEVREIYPFGLEHAVRVALPPLSRELDGASRPGHFEGVASVVCRLLNIVTPDVLVLGQKDYQQVTLLRLMIEDLRLPVAVRVGATLREADGLAFASSVVSDTTALVESKLPQVSVASTRKVIVVPATKCPSPAGPTGAPVFKPAVPGAAISPFTRMRRKRALEAVSSG